MPAHAGTSLLTACIKLAPTMALTADQPIQATVLKTATSFVPLHQPLSVSHELS